jgi:diguanylate cyclase (GGDEF)-like protein
MNMPSSATPVALIVRVAIVAVTLTLFLNSSLHAMLGHRDIAVLSALAAPLGISSWGFARAGHHEAAIMLLSGVLLVVVTLVLLMSPLGVHDVAITAYGGIVLVASLLLSRPNFLAVTTLTMAGATTAFVLDITGHTRSLLGHVSGWPQLAVFLLVTTAFAVIGRVAAEALFGSLGAAQRAAAGDALTGLANRAGFEAGARRVLKRAAAGGGTCVLLLVQIEAHRRLRVMVGSSASDRMLAEAARRVVSVAGDGLVGRVSDAEFAILARDLPTDRGAEDLAAKVRQALDFEFSGVAVRSTVGFGRFPKDADHLDALLLAAEGSLLAAQLAERR